ncbi:ornithine carbamoyltransferase [Glaciibacter superstes]|uniref:ornithine carbamoyltransferase n=1 Tax=Glaciibacter superstes TaxID=501023 RepID=UPI0003B39996|nr:ornithine carbamoyltransferase [Glaciibacter superstes]
MTSLLPPRHLLEDSDLTREQLEHQLGVAAHLKTERANGVEQQRLIGKTIALLFEKPSTRTRAAFEVAIDEQGGHCTYIDPASSHVGVTESIEDTAIVLGRLYDGIAFRGYAHNDVEALARFAGVPVWNGLTDRWHPTQALADLLTMREHAAKPLEQLAVCFLGDARDNVANSLLTSGALIGMDVRIACPDALRPEDDIIHAAGRIAATSGGRVLVTDDIDQAVTGADFLYTDVWVSMGEPREAWAERIPLLRPYRIDQAMVQRTGNPAVKVLHCLPAIHDQNSQLGHELFTGYGLDGAEVSDDVFRSPHSIVFDQAENRLHTIKAVMLCSLNRSQPILDGA